MKKFNIIFMLLTVMILSSCAGIKYTETEYTLNGNPVYSYVSKEDNCDGWYNLAITLDDDRIFNIINTCPTGYKVLVDGEYVSLLFYIGANTISTEELEALNMGFVSIETSIENTIGIDLNEYILEGIIVKELNNDIMVPPQWDTYEVIDLRLTDISLDLVKILSESLGSNSFCEDMSCRLLYSQGPINIILSKGTDKVLIELYDDHLNIKRFENNDEFVSVIYSITSPVDNVSHLYHTIYQRYLEINE